MTTLQDTVKKTAVAIAEGDLEQARKNAEKASSRVKKLALDNPGLAAGVLLGAGAAVGALLGSALRRTPSPGEAVLDGLQRGGESAVRLFEAGMRAARKSVR